MLILQAFLFFYVAPAIATALIIAFEKYDLERTIDGFVYTFGSNVKVDTTTDIGKTALYMIALFPIINISIVFSTLTDMIFGKD